MITYVMSMWVVVWSYLGKLAWISNLKIDWNNDHSFDYLKKLYIIFDTPVAVYSGVFIKDSTHVFYTGLGQSTQELSLYILYMLEFRELIVLDNFIIGKAWPWRYWTELCCYSLHTFLV
jgi:hypothetical protein